MAENEPSPENLFPQYSRFIIGVNHTVNLLFEIEVQIDRTLLQTQDRTVYIDEIYQRPDGTDMFEIFKITQFSDSNPGQIENKKSVPIFFPFTSTPTNDLWILKTICWIPPSYIEPNEHDDPNRLFLVKINPYVITNINTMNAGASATFTVNKPLLTLSEYAVRIEKDYFGRAHVDITAKVDTGIPDQTLPVPQAMVLQIETSTPKIIPAYEQQLFPPNQVISATITPLPSRIYLEPRLKSGLHRVAFKATGTDTQYLTIQVIHKWHILARRFEILLEWFGKLLKRTM